jgi:hypothetical protein
MGRSVSTDPQVHTQSTPTTIDFLMYNTSCSISSRYTGLVLALIIYVNLAVFVALFLLKMDKKVPHDALLTLEQPFLKVGADSKLMQY